MEKQHRDIITKNMELLVSQTSDLSLEMLTNFLVRDGVFTEEMAAKYRDPQKTTAMRKTWLYLDVQTRGPQAFGKLITALQEADYNDLAAALNPKRWLTAVNKESTSSGCVPMALPNYMLEYDENLVENLTSLAVQHPNATVNLNTEPLRVNVIPGTLRLDNISGKLPRYPMGTRPKGLALIINIQSFENDVHEFRLGALNDSINMKALFEQLGYVTEAHLNLNKKDFIETINGFVQRPEHAKVASCMVCIMSHGNMRKASNNEINTVIFSADNLPIYYEEILEKFNAEYCPALIGKPKVFFFQACRGEEKNLAVRNVGYVGRTQTDGVGNFPKRKCSDILIAHSTVRGYVANRDIYTGSWFIQTVVEVFMEQACEEELTDMLKTVDLRISGLISEENTHQTTTVENIGFNRKFYFCPGLYDDDPSGGPEDPAETPSRT